MVALLETVFLNGGELTRDEAYTDHDISWPINLTL